MFRLAVLALAALCAGPGIAADVPAVAVAANLNFAMPEIAAAFTAEDRARGEARVRRFGQLLAPDPRGCALRAVSVGRRGQREGARRRGPHGGCRPCVRDRAAGVVRAERVDGARRRGARRARRGDPGWARKARRDRQSRARAVRRSRARGAPPQGPVGGAAGSHRARRERQPDRAVRAGGRRRGGVHSRIRSSSPRASATRGGRCCCPSRCTTRSCREWCS